MNLAEIALGILCIGLSIIIVAVSAVHFTIEIVDEIKANRRYW